MAIVHSCATVEVNGALCSVPARLIGERFGLHICVVRGQRFRTIST
jgi:hypothetical protein